MRCCIRDAAEQSMVDAIPKDLSRPWDDPNPEAGERIVASALRGIGRTVSESVLSACCSLMSIQHLSYI